MNDLHLSWQNLPPWFHRPYFCMFSCVEKKSAIGKLDNLEGNQSLEGEGSAKIGCVGHLPLPPLCLCRPYYCMFFCVEKKSVINVVLNAD